MVRWLPPLLLALPPVVVAVDAPAGDAAEANARALLIERPGAATLVVTAAPGYSRPAPGVSGYRLSASAHVGAHDSVARADVPSALLLGGALRVTGAWARAEAPGEVAASAGSLSFRGRAVEAPVGVRVSLGHAAYVVAEPGITHGAAGLLVHLVRPVAGLPAGTDILVAEAEATAPPAPPRVHHHRHAQASPHRTHSEHHTAASHDGGREQRQAPTHARPRHDGARSRPTSAARDVRRGNGRSSHGPRVASAPPALVQGAQPLLGGGPYRFPVAGPAQFTDTFGAFRADTGWHHGDDIFAAPGTALVAVADGVLSQVGWNHLGGRRLWLRDDAGNRFYYAHLAGFAAGVRSGLHVRAGQLLGFVGTSGDAAGTPSHLHFEIHPRLFLALGYDGAVDPTSYLESWPHEPAPLAAGTARPQPASRPHPAASTASAASAGRPATPGRAAPATLAVLTSGPTPQGNAGGGSSWPLAAALLLLASPLCAPPVRARLRRVERPQGAGGSRFSVGTRVRLPDGALAVVTGRRGLTVMASRLAGARPGRPLAVRAELLSPA